MLHHHQQYSMRLVWTNKSLNLEQTLSEMEATQLVRDGLHARSCYQTVINANIAHSVDLSCEYNAGFGDTYLYDVSCGKLLMIFDVRCIAAGLANVSIRVFISL
eukprot:868998_1